MLQPQMCCQVRQRSPPNRQRPARTTIHLQQPVASSIACRVTHTKLVSRHPSLHSQLRDTNGNAAPCLESAHLSLLVAGAGFAFAAQLCRPTTSASARTCAASSLTVIASVAKRSIDWLTGDVLSPALRAHCVRPNSRPANLSSLRSSQRHRVEMKMGPTRGPIFHLVAGARFVR
jgi:hypothetical protein